MDMLKIMQDIRHSDPAFQEASKQQQQQQQGVVKREALTPPKRHIATSEDQVQRDIEREALIKQKKLEADEQRIQQEGQEILVQLQQQPRPQPADLFANAYANLSKGGSSSSSSRMQLTSTSMQEPQGGLGGSLESLIQQEAEKQGVNELTAALNMSRQQKQKQQHPQQSKKLKEMGAWAERSAIRLEQLHASKWHQQRPAARRAVAGPTEAVASQVQLQQQQRRQQQQQQQLDIISRVAEVARMPKQQGEGAALSWQQQQQQGDVVGILGSGQELSLTNVQDLLEKLGDKQAGWGTAGLGVTPAGDGGLGETVGRYGGKAGTEATAAAAAAAAGGMVDRRLRAGAKWDAGLSGEQQQEQLQRFFQDQVFQRRAMEQDGSSSSRGGGGGRDSMGLAEHLSQLGGPSASFSRVKPMAASSAAAPAAAAAPPAADLVLRELDKLQQRHGQQLHQGLKQSPFSGNEILARIQLGLEPAEAQRSRPGGLETLLSDISAGVTHGVTPGETGRHQGALEGFSLAEVLQGSKEAGRAAELRRKKFMDAVERERVEKAEVEARRAKEEMIHGEQLQQQEALMRKQRDDRQQQHQESSFTRQQYDEQQLHRQATGAGEQQQIQQQGHKQQQQLKQQQQQQQEEAAAIAAATEERMRSAMAQLQEAAARQQRATAAAHDDDDLSSLDDDDVISSLKKGGKGSKAAKKGSKASKAAAAAAAAADLAAKREKKKAAKAAASASVAGLWAARMEQLHTADTEAPKATSSSSSSAAAAPGVDSDSESLLRTSEAVAEASSREREMVEVQMPGHCSVRQLAGLLGAEVEHLEELLVSLGESVHSGEWSPRGGALVMRVLGGCAVADTVVAYLALYV
jgi:hypothetical protein